MKITINGQVTKDGSAVSVIGTHLVGEITAFYPTLEAVFGVPEKGDEYKIDALWTMETPEGVATIYNYKDGKNYNGAEGLETKDITNWHIGGERKEVIEYVKRAIDRYNHERVYTQVDLDLAYLRGKRDGLEEGRAIFNSVMK